MRKYKTIHELTKEQFEELRDTLEKELAAEPDGVPDGMVDSDGRILDKCVVAQYENTRFTDDDFACTAK